MPLYCGFFYPTNADLKNILKNINSPYESKKAKFHYISEKAKELGFDFTPKEIETASTKVKKYRFFPKTF